MDDKPKCVVEGCDRKVTVKDMCSKHYQHNRIHGHPTDTREGIKRGRPTTRDTTCSIFGCNRPVHSKGLCKTHYSRSYHGQPVTTYLEQQEMERMVDPRTAHPDDPGYIKRFIDPDHDETGDRKTISQLKAENPDLPIYIEGVDVMPEWWHQHGFGDKKQSQDEPEPQFTSDMPTEDQVGVESIEPVAQVKPLPDWSLESPGQEPQAIWEARMDDEASVEDSPDFD